MDLSTISSISSANTKLMIASVKAKAASTTSSSTSSSTSTDSTTSSSSTSGSSAAASTATTTTATSSDTSSTDTATKIAELEAELEAGQSLTAEEIKFLNTNSPGTYERILKSLTEKTDYTSSLNNTSTDSEAASVHMNKLSDMLTEAKSISNDSSLSESDKFSQLQSLNARVSSIEDLTYQYGLGNTGTDTSSAFKTMLGSISDAKQQSVIFKYHPEYASSSSSSTDSTSTSSTASKKSSTTTSSSSSTSSSTSTAAETAAASTTGTTSTGSTSTSTSASSAEDILSEIRSIITNQTASSISSGVKSAGLNLLV